MNNNDFRKDTYEYIDQLFSINENNRKIFFEIYNMLYTLLKDNDIPCYASYGTLIGVIRDKTAMLPWDMDMDVIVPIIYREKLIKVLENLPDDYAYIGIENEKKYPVSEIRIYKKGTYSEEFHIDIFFIIGAPNEPKKQIKLSKKISKLFFARIYKFRDISSYKSNKVLYYLKFLQNKIKGILPLFVLNYKYEKLLKKYDYNNSNYFAVIEEKGKVFSKDILNDSKEIEVEGLKFLVFGDYDKFLKTYYNNYMSYLPIKNRFEEFYKGILRKEKSL